MTNIDTREADVLKANTTLGCSLKCDLGDVGSDEATNTRGELYREMSFRTGKFEGPFDRTRGNKREGQFVLPLFIGATVLPWIWFL